MTKHNVNKFFLMVRLFRMRDLGSSYQALSFIPFMGRSILSKHQQSLLKALSAEQVLTQLQKLKAKFPYKRLELNQHLNRNLFYFHLNDEVITTKKLERKVLK